MKGPHDNKRRLGEIRCRIRALKAGRRQATTQGDVFLKGVTETEAGCLVPRQFIAKVHGHVSAARNVMWRIVYGQWPPVNMVLQRGRRRNGSCDAWCCNPLHLRLRKLYNLSPGHVRAPKALQAEVHRLHRLGFPAPSIARHLDLSLARVRGELFYQKPTKERKRCGTKR